MDGRPLARRAERLTRRSSDEKVHLSGFEAKISHDLLGSQLGDVLLVNLERVWSNLARNISGWLEDDEVMAVAPKFAVPAKVPVT